MKILDEKDFNSLQKSIFSSFLKEYFSDKEKRINILEAGCGKKWNFDIHGIDYVMTGLDISKESLELSKLKQKDLDEIIIGDLRTVKLNDATYNAVYCAYVLEHINGQSMCWTSSSGGSSHTIS